MAKLSVLFAEQQILFIPSHIFRFYTWGCCSTTSSV